MDGSRNLVLVFPPESSFPRSAQDEPASSPTDKDKKTTDSHNEIERRRKQKIRKGIKQLSETLKPPCQCGKTTTSQVLQKVVDQITTLQEENKQLTEKIARLPKPGSGAEAELGTRFIELLLEHIFLKSQLLESERSRSTGTVTEMIASFSTAELHNGDRETEAETMEEDCSGNNGGGGAGREHTGGVASGNNGGGGAGREHTAVVASRNNGGGGAGEHTGVIASEAEGRSSIHVSPQRQSWPVTSILSLNSHPQPPNETGSLPASVEPLHSSTTVAYRAYQQDHTPPPLLYHVRNTSRPPESNTVPTNLAHPLPLAPTSAPLGDTNHNALHHCETPVSVAPVYGLPPTNVTEHPSSRPLIVQPWVDTTAGSRPSSSFPRLVPETQFTSCGGNSCSTRLRHHPRSSGATTRLVSGGNQQTHLSGSVHPNKDSPLRFRPYHPPLVVTRSQDTHGTGNGVISSSPTYHPSPPSSKHYKLRIHPPLTSSHFTSTTPTHHHHSSNHSCAPVPSGPPYSSAAAPPPPPYFNHNITFPPVHTQQLPPSSTPRSHCHPIFHPPPPAAPSQGTVWRPYSERTRGSGFCLADIISLPSSEENGLELNSSPPPAPPTSSGRIPSFLVDRLLDDTGI